MHPVSATLLATTRMAYTPEAADPSSLELEFALFDAERRVRACSDTVTMCDVGKEDLKAMSSHVSRTARHNSRDAHKELAQARAELSRGQEGIDIDRDVGKEVSPSTPSVVDGIWPPAAPSASPEHEPHVARPASPPPLPVFGPPTLAEAVTEATGVPHTSLAAFFDAERLRFSAISN